MKAIGIVAGFALLSLNSFAGTIVASGDISIADSVTGGNAQFFHNVLGTGTNVLLQDQDSATLPMANNIGTFYNGLPGVTSTTITSATFGSLAGVNLFITMLPQVAYTSGEISSMSAFLNAGGTLMFISDSTGYFPASIADPLINTALASLGSSMAMSGSDGSIYPQSAVIVANPLTAGVSSFTYGFTSLVSGGTPLFETSGGAAPVPFVEVQTGVNPPAPEPGTEALIGVGVAAFGLLGRRKRTS